MSTKPHPTLPCMSAVGNVYKKDVESIYVFLYKRIRVGNGATELFSVLFTLLSAPKKQIL